MARVSSQIARMVPGGGEAMLPEIPTNVEPIAFGLTVRPDSVETALVLPAGVLGLGYDQILEGVMRSAGVTTPASQPGAGGTP